jgi:hypothetical protein
MNSGGNRPRLRLTALRFFISISKGWNADPIALAWLPDPGRAADRARRFFDVSVEL